MNSSHPVFWTLSIVLLGSAFIAAWVRDLRVAVLALWIAGLACGGIFLERGAEFLGICQWILSTLAAVVGFFYAVFLGEFGVKTPRPKGRTFAALLLSACWASVLIFAVNESAWERGANLSRNWTYLPPLNFSSQQGLSALGQVIVEENILGFEVLILMVFMAIIGASVISRTHRDPELNSQEKPL